MISLVVCCTQELSSVSKRGLPFWVPKWCSPLGGDIVQRQWQQLRDGGEWQRGVGYRGESECFQHEGPENFSPELKETRKLTK